MILDDIVDAAHTAVEAMTPTSYAIFGGPAQFEEIESGDLEDVGVDRQFEIRIDGNEERTSTGTTGKCDRVLKWTLRVLYQNEGRNERQARTAIVQDGTQLQDKVASYINTSVSAVCTFSDGTLTLKSGDDPGVVVLEVPFISEYTDDIITS